MKPVSAHLTYLGKPLCESQYPASPVYGMQCSYSSLAEAKRVASNLRHYSNGRFNCLRPYEVKVVRGCCPTFESSEVSNA